MYNNTLSIFIPVIFPGRPQAITGISALQRTQLYCSSFLEPPHMFSNCNWGKAFAWIQTLLHQKKKFHMYLTTQYAFDVAECIIFLRKLNFYCKPLVVEVGSLSHKIIFQRSSTFLLSRNAVAALWKKKRKYLKGRPSDPWDKTLLSEMLWLSCCQAANRKPECGVVCWHTRDTLLCSLADLKRSIYNSRVNRLYIVGILQYSSS